MTPKAAEYACPGFPESLFILALRGEIRVLE